MKKTRWIKTGAIFIFALLAFVVETDPVFAKTITGRISAKTVKVSAHDVPTSKNVNVTANKSLLINYSPPCDFV